jgi:hypothetical protein
MDDLLGSIIILMLIICLLPLGVLRYAERNGDAEISRWKSISCVLLFEFSFAPYAFLVSASHSVLKWVNLICFLSIWMSFFIARNFLPARFSLVAPIAFGLMLIEPASSFVFITDNRMYFRVDNGSTINLSSGGNELIEFLHILYKISWAIFPMLGVHYLMKSVEK